MNIDVREYLRINPISVHELTLSGDGKDCFLYFPKNSNGTGYDVYTQKTMFWSICKTIFRNLVVDCDGRLTLNTSISGTAENPVVVWDNGIHLTDDQFTSWVRKHVCPETNFGHVFETFKYQFEYKLSELELNVDKKIFELKSGAKCDYQGAVELQTGSMKPKGWKTPDFSKLKYDSNGELDWKNIWDSWEDSDNPIYNDFKYGIGEIWCYDNGTEVPSGEDSTTLGQNTISHTHNATKAETMTNCFTNNFGGQNLIGKFTLGKSELISQDDKYGATEQTRVSAFTNGVPDAGEDGLTYPLWGQNVINWRNRTKTHNNIPPSTNIYVRFSDKTRTRGVLERSTSIDIREIQEQWSAAEAQYQSLTVPKLDEYTSQNLTLHDYLLRMTLDGSNVSLMKQSVQMLLDIFAKDVSDRLGQEINGGAVTMESILKPKLNEELVIHSEFMQWYYSIVSRLDVVQRKINEIKDLITAAPPLNYIGRIIISTTDDTEQKVIKHYGGKHWRRMTNFLRGVEEGDPGIGKKLGEEYVCLRESNVPIHTHDALISNIDTTSNNKWLMKNKGGQTTKLLNTAFSDVNGGIESRQTSNVSINYQLSPLEYEKRADITIPHDNMPPYKEVYIWECVESTIEERYQSGEPLDNYCTIIWDYNDGVTPSETIIVKENTLLGNASYPQGQLPTPPAREGYAFVGWFDEEGSQASPNDKVTKSMTYHAEWSAQTCHITFNFNNAVYGNETDTTLMVEMEYGKTLGALPDGGTPPDDDWGDETEFDDWYTERNNGSRITSETIVTGDKTYYAHWKRYIAYTNVGGVNIDSDGIATGFGPGKYLLSVRELDFTRDFEIVIAATTGSGTATDWDGTVKDVIQINQEVFGMIAPGSDIEFGIYRGKFCWEVVNGWIGGPNDGSNTLGEHDISENTKYWWRVTKEGNLITCYYSTDGSTQEPDYEPGSRQKDLSSRFIFGADIDSGSEGWRGSIDMKNSYIIIHGRKYNFVEKQIATVTFDSNGGSAVASRSMQIGRSIGTLPSSALAGHHMNGWYTAKTGGTKITSETIITEDVTFYAHWDINSYTVTFDPQGGSSVPQMSMTHNQTLGTLPSTTRAGHTLDGWWTERTGGTQATETTKVTRNTTYYAHWTANTYTITLDANGGTPSQQTMSATYGQEVGALPSASLLGNTFLGWFSDSNTQILPTTKYTLTSNATYHAHWTLQEFYVRWNGNGGVPARSVDAVKYNSTISSPPTCSRTGYTFNDWWTALTGGTKLTSETRITGNTTYYAHWEVNTYTIRFNSQGGSDVQETTRTHGQELGILPTPTRSNYTFGGWSESYDGSELVDQNYVVTDDMTLYAKWIGQEYVVEYNGNGHTNGAMQPTVHRLGVWQNLARNEYSRIYNVTMYASPGYFTIDGVSRDSYIGHSEWKFSGWATSSEGNVRFLDNQYVRDLPFDETSRRLLLYAVWAADSATTQIMPTTPARVGYHLKEWQNANGQSIVSANTSFVPTEDISIYAVWSPNNHTVTFDAQGGSGGDVSKSVTFDAPMPLTMPPKRTGYSFNGYFSAANGGGTKYYTDGGTSARNWDIDESRLLYAKWTANKYTIHLDKAGGVGGSDSVTATYDKTIPSIAIPKKGDQASDTRYAFDGYYDRENGRGSKYFNNVGTGLMKWQYPGDITVIANWVKQYVLRYRPDSWSLGDEETSIKTHDKVAYIKQPIFTRAGYTQIGWVDFVGTEYYPGDQWTANEPAVFLPLWQANTRTYKIALHANAHRGETWPGIDQAKFGPPYNSTTIGYTPYGEVTPVDGHQPIEVTYGETYENLPIPTCSGYVFDCWFDDYYGIEETPNSKVNPTDPVRDHDSTFWAQWKPKPITSVDYIRCYYDTDFTAENNGWHYSSNSGNQNDAASALKWIGSEHTRNWIQFQNSFPLEVMCSRLTAPANMSERFFYTPNREEMGYVTQDGGLENIPSDNYVGVGGTAITKIIPKPGVLITKIEFSPYASGVSYYTDYSDGNDLIYDESEECMSGDTCLYFKADLIGNNMFNILSVGGKFEATMSLSDGSTITVKSSERGNYSAERWISSPSPVENEMIKQEIEFDFSSSLIGKPRWITTEYITFTTSGGPSGRKYGLLLMNGMICYKMGDSQ